MKILTTVLFATAFAVIGCSKDSSNINDPYFSTDSVTVPIGQCITKKYKGDTTITYCLDSINDSRCPDNAVCIWQGYAAAKMNLTINQVTHKVILNTPISYPPFTNDTTIAGFRFKLVDVTPYPTLPQTNTNKSAIVKVIRL